MLNDEIKYDWLSKDNWISVNDRLPEDGIFVLVWHNPYQVVMWYDEQNFMFKDNQHIWHNDITHWMPLPDPPNDSE